MDPRARPARLGHDTEQPRQRALDARATRERHRPSARSGQRLPRRAQGKDPRARPAPLGHDTEQPRQRALALGERESGTERLLEAVSAFRDALKEWTRERVPLLDSLPAVTSDDPTAPFKFRRAEELLARADLLDPNEMRAMVARVRTWTATPPTIG